MQEVFDCMLIQSQRLLIILSLVFFCGFSYKINRFLKIKNKKSEFQKMLAIKQSSVVGESQGWRGSVGQATSAWGMVS